MTEFLIMICIFIIIGTVIYLIYRSTKDISNAVSKKNAKQEFDDKVKRLTPQYESMYKEYIEKSRNETDEFFEHNTEKYVFICNSDCKPMPDKKDKYVAISKDKNKLMLIDMILPRKHVVSYRPESTFGTYIVEPKPLRIEKKEWEISKVLYFKIEGDLQYTASVNGGGVNLGGAVAGAVIAGAAGAIVGSRNAVSSETVKHDNRAFVLAFDGDKDFIVKENVLEYYNAFMKLVPQKEVSVYMKSSIPDASVEKIDSNELVKMKELLDQGIITQEEFDTKKKQILGL